MTVHKWNTHPERGGAPHLCESKPHWWHTPNWKSCCTIKNGEITCPECLKILRDIESQSETE